MVIETKFNLGDEVYWIANLQEKKWIPCKACAETGKVILLDNEEHNCPICYGNKGQYNWLPTKWMINCKGTIGQVRVEITKGEISDQHQYEYMINETGIGSGTVYREKDLFFTRDRAQLECDKRNVEI